MEEIENVKSLVRRYQDAIHSQQRDEFYRLWAKGSECTLISITNQYKGIDTIYNDFLIGRIQQSYESIDLIDDYIDVQMINDQFAIVIFEYHTECIKRDTKESYGIQGLETQIIVKEDNEWKLLHVHYSK